MLEAETDNLQWSRNTHKCIDRVVAIILLDMSGLSFVRSRQKRRDIAPVKRRSRQNRR